MQFSTNLPSLWAVTTIDTPTLLTRIELIYHYFMFNWYIAQNPDVAINRIHPFYHWVKYGRFEGRSLFKPLWFNKKITKRNELLSELLELNDITFGHLDQLIGAISGNKESSKMLIYRVHNYKRHTRRLIFTLFAVSLIGNSLELVSLDKKNSFFRQITIQGINILYKKRLPYYIRNYDIIKKEIDILVLMTILTNKSEINVIGLGNNELDLRIKSLLGKKNQLTIVSKVQ
jgi:hypothetical protein